MSNLDKPLEERWYSLNKDKYEVGKIVSKSKYKPKTRYSEKLKEAILKAL